MACCSEDDCRAWRYYSCKLYASQPSRPSLSHQSPAAAAAASISSSVRPSRTAAYDHRPRTRSSVGTFLNTLRASSSRHPPMCREQKIVIREPADRIEPLDDLGHNKPNNANPVVKFCHRAGERLMMAIGAVRANAPVLYIPTLASSLDARLHFALHTQMVGKKGKTAVRGTDT